MRECVFFFLLQSFTDSISIKLSLKPALKCADRCEQMNSSGGKTCWCVFKDTERREHVTLETHSRMGPKGCPLVCGTPGKI